MASVRTTRLLRASTIRPDRPNGGRDRSVTAPLYSRSREPPADAVASRCLGSVPLQEVLDGVLNAFGSRMGVGDPLDRDDVSTTMCHRKLIPDRCRLGASLERFRQILGGLDLAVWLVPSHR